MYHDILHEKDRRPVLNDIRVFVRGAFGRDHPWRETDDVAYTRDEYERLLLPLPRFSPKRIWFAAQRAFLKTYGRLSNGIRIGGAGFDPGSRLIMCTRTARGALPLAGSLTALLE
jgi:hypothetical protein